MMGNIRELVPRIDADFGIERTPDELEAKLRVFMSLFVGYFTTSLFLEWPPNDEAIVESMLIIMGWEGSTEA